MSAIRFSHPWLLLLALIPPALAFISRLPFFRRRGWLSLSSYDWIPAAGMSRSYPRWLAFLSRFAALVCLSLIVAGIRFDNVVSLEQPEALIIVLDVSSSMTAEDFSPVNRLEVAKKLLSEFAVAQAGADLGLILLSATPRLMVPATPERGAIAQALSKAVPAGYEEDGTAIGSGIASAVNRLRSGPWNRRRIILVTDGVNNRGALAPTDAARIAAGMGIRIDTVGIGTDTVARYWAPSALGAPIEVKARIRIDDKALEDVSRITGGSYRRVTNPDEMRRALESLATERKQIPAATATQPDHARIRFLVVVAIFLIGIEFTLTRFIFPELPG
jgi:Ca-activated chloride channel family protein